MERTTPRYKHSTVFGPTLTEEKEGGLLSSSAEAKQLSINLLFTMRAAASVGYTELPLAFQKNRLSWVPSVLCLSSKQPCLPSHRAQTKNQRPYKPQTHLKWWDVPKILPLAVPGKQRESWDAVGAASSRLSDHPRHTCTEPGPLFSTPIFTN